MTRRRLLWPAILLLVVTWTSEPRTSRMQTATAQAAVAPAAAGLDSTAPRTASYRIDARLDPTTRALTGTAFVTWTNPGDVPASALRLHLYWNAWRNTESAWLRQLQLAGLGRDLADRPEADFGWQDVTELRLVGPDGSPQADLMGSFRFVDTADAPSDRTLATADLPVAVAPKETIHLSVAWRARVPRPFARTGAIGNYFFLAHWFPKLGAFDRSGWNARPFYANTEFSADFGAYDVRLRVPRTWVVGATGREVSRTDDADGTTVHQYVQENVHDFAWTTSPDFLEYTRRFEHERLPPVEMRLLLQPEHRGQEDRHFAATAAALRYYGEWFGPYSYPQITIVDPAWQSDSGGMEYPTLFTAGTRWLAPRRSNEPEAVTVHEAGHQFWYGMVASNEVTDAWMDEGINTYSEARVLSVALAPDYRVLRFFGGFIPWQLRDVVLSRATDGSGLDGYRQAARRDVPATPTHDYWPASHWNITYFKTALWLHTLERFLGWERLQPALAAYFREWRFRHPTPDDFFATISRETGEDLTWFFDQVHRSAAVFDYAVERLDSAPLESRGFYERGLHEPGAGTPETAPALTFAERRTARVFRTAVVVRRDGDGVFPVDVLVRFEDGHEVRERWDGRSTWRAFHYERPARAVSAQVDPDRVLLLDVNYTNNSVTLEPRTEAAARTWTLQWMVWLQDLLMTWAFFV
jgi:hypothetical protein